MSESFGKDLPPWMPELMDQVRAAFQALEANKLDVRPDLETERREIGRRIGGWSQSLANPDLAPNVRAALEREWGAAQQRLCDIDAQLVEESTRSAMSQALLCPEDAIERLGRLDEVLANENPTLGNLALSRHIDRIECRRDGRIALRICKLGLLPGAIEPLSDKPSRADGQLRQGSRPRQRTRLRVDCENDEDALMDLVSFATDPDRFAGLGDEWFLIQEYSLPGRTLSWVKANAEQVFRRRQESHRSYSKLAHEFGVTSTTIGATIRHYLNTHPGTKDEVKLRCGGRRKPKFDLSAFADEARALYEAGWPKEKLAKKYKCSPPVIVKALDFSYRKAGLRLPTRADRRATAAAEARRLFEVRPSREYIAAAMNVSDITARKYLAESFRAKGEPMPDLRSLRGKVGHGPSRGEADMDAGDERPAA
jgi:hypothetical protein